MLTIKILNTVHSQVDAENISTITPAVSYKETIWKFSPRLHRKVRQSYTNFLIDANGIFWTGLIPRIRNYLRDKEIDFEVQGKKEPLWPTNDPEVKGKVFRPDQNELIDASLNKQRGVVVSPTGSGKTLLAGALFTCFRRHKKLFLVDTSALLKQAVSDFTEYGLENITTVDKTGKNLTGEIVVAMRQSFVNLDPAEADIFDVIVVDECHGISSKDVGYVDILNNLNAPVRIGLTATYPSAAKSYMAIEGVLGPVIGEFTEEEAVEAGIIAKTKVILRQVPFDKYVSYLSNYQDVYKKAVVQHIGYNRQVIKEAKYWIDRGLTVLIIFVEIEHGKLLKSLAKELGIDNYAYIDGEIDSDYQEQIRKDFTEKRINLVIASMVWKKGINVPTIGTLINALGGKSDILIRQMKGRGGRVTKDKDTLIYVDFFNPSHEHLIRQFGQRMCLYFELGWMGDYGN